MEIKEVRTDVMQRLDFGNGKIKRITVEMDLISQERAALASKSERLEKEVQSASSLKDVEK